MYIAATRRADQAGGRTAVGTSRGFTRNVPANVLALGTVSLVTDISAEMVTAVLPTYLVLTLGLSPLQYGLLDGGWFGVTAMVRLLGGQIADRTRRRKLVAGTGYGLSAVCKLGLPLVGSSVAGLGLVLAADRTGKGLRTAPRDALITLSTPTPHLGRAFGVHRAMDTVGAFLGPLAAFAVLWTTHDAYDAVFVVSFCVATFGVLLLMLYVRDHREPAPPRRSASLRAAFGLLRLAPFRRTCVAAALLGLLTVGDTFVYLVLQRGFDIPLRYFPLLPLGTAGAFLLLAVPIGRLADRVGRFRVFLGGHLALLAAYLVAAAPTGGHASGTASRWAVLLLVLGLQGLFYAATDGVLMAAAGPLLPVHLRTSGLALLQTGQAGARLLSSVVFGAAWTLWGAGPALYAMGAGLAGCLLLARRLLPSAPLDPEVTG
ncbi:MFS transporter [Embleya scabrispora]|uniref:MFS transporter n=1 Tax=Embleya scabrispora TaxID=159449 RepID=A0A1T3NSQ4_9ACTN|nr:MFS transporter [Embleya scabrispora]OPC79712.1 MFS transporter [Embleya scabrispora]